MPHATMTVVQHESKTVEVAAANAPARVVSAAGVIACFGDSITQGDPTTTRVYPTWLKWYLGLPVLNAGISGNTTTMMLARVQADVIAQTPKPKVCIVLGGTNDNRAGVALSTITTNLGAICTALVAAGIQPILCTIPPRSDFPADTPGLKTLNAWIRSYAVANSMPLVDVWGLFVDPLDRPIEGMLVDGLHPSLFGMQQIARLCAGANGALWAVSAEHWSTAADNLTDNPGFLVDGDVDGVPDGAGWGVSGTAGIDMTSDLLTSHDLYGKWWHRHKNATGLSKTTGIVGQWAVTPGQTYRFSIDMKWSKTAATLLPMYLQYGATITYIVRNPVSIEQSRFRPWVEVTPDQSPLFLYAYGQGVDAFDLWFGRAMLEVVS